MTDAGIGGLVAVLGVTCGLMCLKWNVGLVPALGVMDWSDIAVMSVMTIVFPFALLALPPFAITLLTGGIIVAAVSDLLRRPLPKSLRLGLGVALVSVTWLLGNRDHDAAWVFSGVLLLVVVGTGASAWARSGMRMAHIAAFSGFLIVYDLVATVTHFMMDLVEHIGTQPIPLVITVPTANGDAYIGLGDVFIVVVAPTIASHTHGLLRGIQTGMALVVACVAGIAIADRFFARGFPLMVTIGPMTIAAAWLMSPRRRRRRWPARPAQRAAALLETPVARA